MANAALRLHAPHDNCTLTLQHLRAGSVSQGDGVVGGEGGSKFKLLSVMVAPPGQSMEGGLVWGEASEQVHANAAVLRLVHSSAPKSRRARARPTDGTDAGNGAVIT